ncbi:hypothetical protein SeMB42_g00920 [Synchytrium endobioticum]|uniref:RING-type domain-containing protein n=1 Tax=Synchytrium endobioticum TaxID=286115 RepID=A0A507DNH0_9FUNG|nr:hypothetical protein SeMB42_g00920 [Synchytrium endobioticum]
MMTTEAMRANTNDGGDGIDPECRCPVCYEWLEAPVTFECNHSICLGCLQQMLDSAYCKGVCPMCRHRVLNFIRRNAKNPAAMVNQPLAARIAQKRAEGARSTRRPVTPPSTSCKVLRNRIVNTEPPLPKKRKIDQVIGGEGAELENGCDGPSATKRRTAGGGSNRPVNTATTSSEPKSLATVDRKLLANDARPLNNHNALSPSPLSPLPLPSPAPLDNDCGACSSCLNTPHSHIINVPFCCYADSGCCSVVVTGIINGNIIYEISSSSDLKSTNGASTMID